MDSMDEVEPEPPPPPPPPTLTPSLPPISNLILSLEQATLLAKQLPSTTDPTQLLLIHSSLHHAHHHLSTFLSTAHLPLLENSLSSAAGNDPMDFGGDEENSKATIDKVEKQMRGCFIKNKRGRKRQLSPSAAAVAEERRLDGDGLEGSVVSFDPHETKLRALELVHQFHL